MFKKNHKLLVHFVFVLILILGMLGFESIQPVFASTLIVTNTNNSGAGSLRQAITDAASGDTITFNPSLNGQMITLETSLIIDKDLTIDASLLSSPITISGVTTHDGTGNNHVITIKMNRNVILKGLTITKSQVAGYVNNGGIMIQNDAMLTTTGCTISNFAGSGGITNWYGTLTMMNSSVLNNSSASGGGIYNRQGTAVLTNVVISNNSAYSTTGGGGIYNDGEMTITGSTVSNNSGGGIRNDLTLTLTDSTVTGNSGGGIYNDYGYYGTSMTIANSTISNNLGGGIENFGPATVTDSIFEGNSADYGGGIYNTSTLTITNSTFSNNQASDSGYGDGGGIENYAGTLNVQNSTFNGNTAANGGGIYNGGDGVVTINNSAIYDNHAHYGGGFYNTGDMTLNNTTISGNAAGVGTPPYYNDGHGGGIYSSSNLTLNNTTVTNNTSNFIAGGIYNYGLGSTEIYNSILANNIASNYSNDCNGDIISLGYNLIGDDWNCYFVAAIGDLVGTSPNPVNPRLGPLQDNGGPTFTHALMADSPAIDAGDETSCPVTDQRGITRPQGAACDIGAFEAEYTLVDVTVGNTESSSYPLVPHGSRRQNLSGINSGPVKITHKVNDPVLAAERLIYKVNGVNTSFSEMLGLPDGQLDNVYWLPWYNNVDLDTQLRIANTSSNPAAVTVTIGDVEMAPLNLTAGESTRVSYAGMNSGPVKIESDQNIVAAERVIYKVQGVNTSFTEMMALPEKHLDIAYYLPWYNNVDLDTQLRIGNVSGSTATVHVFIGGAEVTPVSGITLLAGESTRQSFPGINDGPVQIVSDQTIVAAERVIYKVRGTKTSFAEMMALPNSQLDTTYWLPWYNNVDLDTQLRFANVSASTATVHIYIGGVEMPDSPFTLLAGESTRQSFTGINNGPVQIVSDQGIVAAERLIYKVNGKNTSFSEMMALPNNLLDTTYHFPWYNNVDLDTQLRFGAP